MPALRAEGSCYPPRMRSPPPPRRTSERDRVKNLLGLDAQGVMERLAARRDAMIELFSRHRDREALLGPLRTSGPASFEALALLEPAEQSVAVAFYEELDRLRWYFRYTDDMPSTAQQVFERHLRRLQAAHAGLAALLGRGEPPPADPAEPGQAARRRRRPRRAGA